MTAALMHEGLERAAVRFGDRDAIRADDDRWSFADLDGWANAFARLPRPTAGSAPADRVAVMTSNRVEFLVAVAGHQPARRRRRAAEPGLEGDRGRPRPRRSPGPATPSPSGAPDALLVDAPRCVVGHSTSTTRRPRRPSRAAPARPIGPRGPRRGTTRRSSSSAPAPPACPRRCATPTARSATPPTDWCAALGLGPDDRFQVATPPSHILGLLNLLAAVEAGATVRLHRRFDLDEVLRHIESERMTLEMAVAPDRPGDGQPPRPRGPRPLVAALHHVGRHAGDRERRPDRHRAHRRPLAARLRRQRAAGHRRQPGRPTRRPGASTPPACRPEGVELRVVDLDDRSCPARRARPARSRSAARRLMAGYLPEAATAEAFVDGWYRTGDVGWLEPEGWVHLTDRSKEMIKVNGLPGGPGRDRGRAPRPPVGGRLRGVRRPRRARPARCPSPPCSSTPTTR